jgi:adenine-specific DNA-methyltransferase
MGKMPSESVDLIVADPPYLTNYSTRDGRRVAGDAQSDWLWPAFEEAYRVLKPDAFCVTFYGWPHADLFLGAWRRAGFLPVSHLVCLKRYSSRKGYTLGCHETLYLLVKGRPPRPVVPGRDVLQWSYSGNVEHPTQKPTETIRELIERFSKADDLVLDPFAGSGTTGVAARQCGRQFILIEKEAICFETARNRLGGGPLSIEWSGSESQPTEASHPDRQQLGGAGGPNGWRT